MKNTNVKTQEKNLAGEAPVTASRAPVPPFLIKIMNPVMKLVLRSPIHGVASKQIMLLSFKGRKTGKRYTTPVGYVRKNNELTVYTHARWWQNLRGGAPVTMRLQGRESSGVAETVDKYETVKRMVRDLMEKNGEKMSRRMGFWIENPDPSPDELRQATQGVTFIRIRLKNGKSNG
jgi:hypothetical protein